MELFKDQTDMVSLRNVILEREFGQNGVILIRVRLSPIRLLFDHVAHEIYHVECQLLGHDE